MAEKQLPSNSHASKKSNEKAQKQPEQKLEKVVKGKVTTRKPSASKKFFQKFVSEDIVDVKDYIVGDVLVPAFKDIIADTVTNAIDMILYGETRGRRGRGRRSRYESTYSYNKYFDSPNAHRKTRNKPLDRSDPFDLDEIIFEEYADADDVLTKLCERIDMYGNASVADLYDATGLDCPWTWNSYGWEALGRAEIVRTSDGYYMLDMPRTKKISNR